MAVAISVLAGNFDHVENRRLFSLALTCIYEVSYNPNASLSWKNVFMVQLHALLVGLLHGVFIRSTTAKISHIW